METNKIPAKPLEKIALSFSGGGYRAATFHLGAMSYLNQLIYQGKPVLENVKMISTVSGGTITGIIYAMKKQDGWSFNQIYHFILNKLQKLDLVKAGVEKLNPGTVWNTETKRKNLINAFAEIYNSEFTHDSTFSVFSKMKSHLDVVVFNSTEFNHAINFRFRNEGTGYFGNNEIRVKQVCANEVRLADAMASSSCFPGGFEPLVWPHDFVHSGAENLRKLAETSNPVGIMDGGIYDNQGIDSILVYDRNKDKDNAYFDLVIISDVASPYMTPYKPTVDKEKEGLRKKNLKELWSMVLKVNRNITLGLAAVTVLFAILPFLNGYANNWLTGLFLGLSASTAILLIAKIFLVRKVVNGAKGVFASLTSQIPPYFLTRLKNLRIEELSFRRVEPLILDRVNALIVLLSSVFLKVVRRLNYNKLYEDDAYQYRRISNLIKELTEEDYANRMKRRQDNNLPNNAGGSKSLFNGTYMQDIGPEIKAVAEDASGFGTTLWFTDDDQLSGKLDKLIATGQFNLCYNMLEYLEKMMFQKDNGFEELDAVTKSDLLALYEQAKADWLKFKIDPMFMVKEMQNSH